MPESPATITRWDDFSGGDYGNLSPDKAPLNSFKANNMLVGSDGTLYVRPGLKNITPASMPNGPLLALAANPVVGHDGVFMIAEQVYTFDLNTPGTAPTNIGAMDNAPQQPIVPIVDTATLLAPCIFGSAPGTQDHVYRIDPAGASVTALTGSLGGDVVALYGQQVVVAKSEFSPQIDASSPVDPNDWTEGRAIDVGDNWQVTAIYNQHNGLAILKRTGLYRLTGVIGDPDTEVVRVVCSHPDGPLHPWQVAQDNNDVIWFWPLFDLGPAAFDGSSYRYYGRFGLPTRENDDTIANTPLTRGVVAIRNTESNDPDTIIFVQGGSSQQAIVRQNGVWTFHSFETDVSGLMAANGNQAVLTDGGSNTTPAQVFSWFLDTNRPAFTTDGLSGVGDNSNTPLDASVTLRQYWEPTGRNFEVRQLVVDFTSYNTGTTQNNHFDIDVKIMGRERMAPSVIYSTDQSLATPAPDPFDQPTSGSTTAGTRQRYVSAWSVPSGSGLEVTIKNIRGCKLHSATALDPRRSESPIA